MHFTNSFDKLSCTTITSIIILHQAGNTYIG